MVTIACVGHNTIRSVAIDCICMCAFCVLIFLFLSFSFCLLFFRFLCDSIFVLFDFSAKLQKNKEDIYLFIHGYRVILNVS